MEKVEKGYAVFFNLWNVTMIPKLLKAHRWFDSKCQLAVGDIVYFKKDDGELSSVWTVGKIVQVTSSKDGLVRRADVQYQNAKESEPRTTDRAARSLIKLFHIDDQDWQADMAEVEKLIADLEQEESVPDATVPVDASVSVDVNAPSYKMSHTGAGLRYRLTATGGYDRVHRVEGVQHSNGARAARLKLFKTCGKCCCASHCLMTSHSGRNAKTAEVLSTRNIPQSLYSGLIDFACEGETEYQEMFMENYGIENDEFMSLLVSINTDLDGAVDDRDVYYGPRL